MGPFDSSCCDRFAYLAVLLFGALLPHLFARVVPKLGFARPVSRPLFRTPYTRQLVATRTPPHPGRRNLFPGKGLFLVQGLAYGLCQRAGIERLADAGQKTGRL